MGGEAEHEPEQSAWLNVVEAADYLGVSESTIWRWLAEGALSSSWVNGTTRFTREGLDEVVRMNAGSKELGTDGTCGVCGHGDLVDGHVQGNGRLYFRPSRARFWVLREAIVPVRARVCIECGHVQLRADTRKLRRLMPARETEGS
jgi:excisionase family DNA binding protein